MCQWNKNNVSVEQASSKGQFNKYRVSVEQVSYVSGTSIKGEFNKYRVSVEHVSCVSHLTATIINNCKCANVDTSDQKFSKINLIFV